MSKGTGIDLGLNEAYNDLFSTQEERDNAGRTFVIDLDPAEISDFPNHPFHVRMDEEMERLVESVKERGVLSPVLVRPMPDGGYQMVSGHRRKRAVELAERPTLSCIVRELTDDEAASFSTAARASKISRRSGVSFPIRSRRFSTLTYSIR